MSLFTPKAGAWLDPVPKKHLAEKVAQQALTPKERKARLEAAMQMCGFPSRADLYRFTGLGPGDLVAMRRNSPMTKTVVKVAVALGVSTDFLLVKGKQRDG